MPNTNRHVSVAVAAAVGLASAAALYFYRRHKSKAEMTKKEEENIEVEVLPSEVARENEPVEKSEVVSEPVPVVMEEKPEEKPEEKSVEKSVEIPVQMSPEPVVENVSAEEVKSAPTTPKKTIPFVELYNGAKKLFNAQNYEEALVQFDKAIEVSPSANSQMKTLVYSRASCLKKLNRLEEAVESYSKCIELDAKYARAYKARAGIELTLERYEQALSDFSYGYLLDIISQGDMQQTPEGMDTAIQALAKRDVKEEQERRRQDPSYEASLPSKQFISFYFSTIHSEKLEALNPDNLTEEQLTRRIEQFPVEGETKTKGDLLLMRGGLYKTTKRYPQAFEDFKAAAEEANACADRDQARVEVATFLSLSGRVREACVIFEELYSASYRSLNMLLKYASCLLEINDPRSQGMFDEVVKLYPKEVDGYFHRGQMYFLQNEMVKSHADLLKATQLKPSFPIAHVQLGYCYANMGDVDKTMESMKRALKCNQNKAQVLNHFGELYLTMGRVQEAEDCFKKAQKEDPRWAYSYVNHAVLIIQTTQDCLACGKLLDKALAVDPSCVNAYLQKAQLHMLLQEWEQTKEMLEKGLKEARTEIDIQQVCALQETVKYQLEATEKYQATLKAEN